MPAIDTRAPDFHLPNQPGKLRRLSTYAERWLVSYFCPRDDSPGCRRITLLVDHEGKVRQAYRQIEPARHADKICADLASLPQ